MADHPPFQVFDSNRGTRTLPLFRSTLAPTNGTSGSFAGVAGPGALLSTSEPALYENTGSLSSPTWTQLPTSLAATIASLTANGMPVNTGSTKAGGLTSAPTPITDKITNATSADATHIAFILPTGVQGDERLVYNSGGASAQTISVYCQTGDTIDGGSSGGNVTLTVAHRAAKFFCVAANTWVSALVGAVST